MGAIALSVRKEVNNPFRSIYTGLFLFAGLSLCTVFPLLGYHSKKWQVLFTILPL